MTLYFRRNFRPHRNLSPSQLLITWALLVCWIFTIGASKSSAQWNSDAFGLYHPDLEPERSHWAGIQNINGTQITVSPDRAETLLIFFEEKSVIIKDNRAMAIAIGFDRYENLMADGLPTQFIITSHDEPIRTVSQNGFAYINLTASTQAGLYEASAEVQIDPFPVSQSTPAMTVQSERQIFRVNADVQEIPIALSSSLPKNLKNSINANLSTDVFIDKHGNSLENGYGVSFQLIDKDGHFTLIPATIVKASAHATLPTAYLKGPQALSAAIAQETAPTIILPVQQTISTGMTPLSAYYDRTLDLLRLNWGPIRTTNGALLPDGTSLDLTITSAEFTTRTEEIWIEQGRAKADLLMRAKDFPITVTFQSVLGQQSYQIAHP